jgi:hypothetical protein
MKVIRGTGGAECAVLRVARFSGGLWVARTIDLSDVSVTQGVRAVEG